MRNLILLSVFLMLSGQVRANLIQANPGNYTTFLTGLVPGDTLLLNAGTYTTDLVLNGVNGTAGQPIVIMGSPNLYSTRFEARSCCNTVSITQCSWLVIKNLELDGMNEAVDAVKGEGTAGNWAHHITLEYLNIIRYGNNQQIVGISTKCHAWNWVIRKNRIIGAGTGLYLGNSNGDKPFVNGLIEYNYVANTIGYNMEIKHQLDTVRNAFAGTAVDGKTIIRHNVFSKEQNGSTGGNARPNVLVGGFPLNGFGMNDTYEIYGNFFWQNPTEALFQGTGNVMLYENIFVNHTDPSGFRAVYIRDQNGALPRNVKVFHNTIWAANTSGGLRIYNADTAYRQYCYGNAVFAPLAITNFADTMHNVSDSYANAGTYVLSATTALNTLDLYPAGGQLTGTSTTQTPFPSCSDYSLDFNGDVYDWTFRGAYSGCCNNTGWQLQLDTMPSPPDTVVTARAAETISGYLVYPHPARDPVRISNVNGTAFEVTLTDLQGGALLTRFCTSGVCELETASLPAGVYLLWLRNGDERQMRKFVKL